MLAGAALQLMPPPSSETPALLDGLCPLVPLVPLAPELDPPPSPELDAPPSPSPELDPEPTMQVYCAAPTVVTHVEPAGQYASLTQPPHLPLVTSHVVSVNEAVVAETPTPPAVAPAAAPLLVVPFSPGVTIALQAPLAARICTRPPAPPPPGP